MYRPAYGRYIPYRAPLGKFMSQLDNLHVIWFQIDFAGFAGL